MTSENNKSLTTEVLYNETGTNFRYTCEWRYRIMARLFLTTGAYMIAASWIWKNFNPDEKKIIFIPFLLGVLTAITLGFADRRNTTLLNAAYSKGKELEKNHSCCEGIYSSWVDKTHKVFRSSLINQIIYILIGMFNFIGFLWALLKL